MSNNLKEYLASKYMSGPKADAILARSSSGVKKKKRKAPTDASSFIKDDTLEFDAPKEKEEDEDGVVAMVASDRSFKKRRMANWETVREPTPPAPDEMPLVVEAEEPPPSGGILTAEQLKRRAALAKAAEAEDDDDDNELQHETVYRDASGRKIDTKAERADAARKKREKEDRESQKMEWGKGLVQRADKDRMRLEEEKERNRGMARYADDTELNQQQRGVERWNDPAAAFLSKKQTKGPKKPAYKGPPPPPNRFGIAPGYRWDGVDRGNGFEKKLVEFSNEKKRRGVQAHEYSVEDM